MANRDWKAIRSQYPAASRCIFLNSGSRGLLSIRSNRAGVEALNHELAMDFPVPSEAALGAVRRLFAELIGANAETIAITKNVSEGLNIVANGIDWRPGDNVVLCSDLEHSNNIYLWHALKARGVEVRDTPSRHGLVDPHAIDAAMDNRTRVISVSAVSFVPGFRTDLKAISSLARRVGALFLVDAVQACGVIRINVAEAGIDALTTSTSKGLLGVRGLGFLFVSPEWCGRLTPAFVARNSYDTGGRHYSEFDGANVALKASAQRFEYGHYNHIGIAVATSALTEILDIGIDAIEVRTTALARSLADGLRNIGYPINDPPAGSARTHLVTLGTQNCGRSGVDPHPTLAGLAARLAEANVRFAIRRGMIRFGVHLYNDEGDIDTVLAVADRHLNGAFRPVIA